jgi:hypothetical protein
MAKMKFTDWLTSSPKDYNERIRREVEGMRKITEKSYPGKNVSPEKKEAAERPKRRSAKKRGTSRYTPEPLPTGNIGSASGEMGPDMGRVNRASDVDYSGMSRTASPEDAAKVDLTSSGGADRVDMHEQARRSMGFGSGMKRGGAVRKKSGGSCGMKSGGSVKSSASRRGDGCAQRGKTRGRLV